MSVTANDIVFYASSNMPQDDASIAGGTINSGLRVEFNDIVATDIVEVLSDNAGDVQNVTIVGRDSAGVIQSDTFALSGLTLVSGVQSFERILTVTIDSVATGLITLRDAIGNTGLGSIATGESGFLRPFYDATANSFGGADKVFYEKIFLKNNNATTALLSTTLTEVASGIYTLVQFGLEKSPQYIESIANRLAVPTGVTSYGSGASGIPNTNLGPLDYQGVWLQLTADDGTVAQNSFYQLNVQGNTT